MFKKKTFGYAIPITKSNSKNLTLLNSGETVRANDMFDTILIVPHDLSKHTEILAVKDFDVMYRWEVTPSPSHMTLVHTK